MGIVEEKVLIVTGASSGIGLATAELALQEGANVLGIDVAAAPAALGEYASFHFIRGDLTDDGFPKRAVQECIRVFGRRIDGLLNIAGVADRFESADSLTDTIWDRCLAVNLTAPVRLMREVIPYMRARQSGSIVNISSKAGLSGAAAGVAYTASKHGLIGVTKNVAWRFKHEQIRCNVVCPGEMALPDGTEVDSSPWDHAALHTLYPIIEAHTQGQPYIQPEEVSWTLLFLMSGASGRINGAVIPVDDAWSAI